MFIQKLRKLDRVQELHIFPLVSYFYDWVFRVETNPKCNFHNIFQPLGISPCECRRPQPQPQVLQHINGQSVSIGRLEATQWPGDKRRSCNSYPRPMTHWKELIISHYTMTPIQLGRRGDFHDVFLATWELTILFLGSIPSRHMTSSLLAKSYEHVDQGWWCSMHLMFLQSQTFIPVFMSMIMSMTVGSRHGHCASAQVRSISQMLWSEWSTKIQQRWGVQGIQDEGIQ